MAVAIVLGILFGVIMSNPLVESARVEVPLANAPVEVRFELKGEWAEWQSLPSPSTTLCVKSAIADHAEFRIPKTFEGYYVHVTGASGQKVWKTESSTGPGTVKVEGVGRIQVKAGTALGNWSLRTYSCDVILTK